MSSTEASKTNLSSRGGLYHTTKAREAYKKSLLESKGDLKAGDLLEYWSERKKDDKLSHEIPKYLKDIPSKLQNPTISSNAGTRTKFTNSTPTLSRSRSSTPARLTEDNTVSALDDTVDDIDGPWKSVHSDTSPPLDDTPTMTKRVPNHKYTNTPSKLYQPTTASLHGQFKRGTMMTNTNTTPSSSQSQQEQQDEIPPYVNHKYAHVTSKLLAPTAATMAARKDKYDSPPMDKYHQPLIHPPPSGSHIDMTNENLSHDNIRDVCHEDDDDDDASSSSVWRDAGGLYAHIPSRLHSPTTGSVHGRRDLDQEKAQALSLEMEKQRNIERATHAPTIDHESSLLRPTFAFSQSTYTSTASPGVSAEVPGRDVGGKGMEEMYAHIPSRLHCPTIGSVHGRRDLDQEKAQALSLEMEKQRSIERATHAPIPEGTSRLLAHTAVSVQKTVVSVGGAGSGGGVADGPVAEGPASSVSVSMVPPQLDSTSRLLAHTVASIQKTAMVSIEAGEVTEGPTTTAQMPGVAVPVEISSRLLAHTTASAQKTATKGVGMGMGGGSSGQKVFGKGTGVGMGGSSLSSTASSTPMPSRCNTPSFASSAFAVNTPPTTASPTTIATTSAMTTSPPPTTAPTSSPPEFTSFAPSASSSYDMSLSSLLGRLLTPTASYKGKIREPAATPTTTTPHNKIQSTVKPHVDVHIPAPVAVATTGATAAAVNRGDASSTVSSPLPHPWHAHLHASPPPSQLPVSVSKMPMTIDVTPPPPPPPATSPSSSPLPPPFSTMLHVPVGVVVQYTDNPSLPPLPPITQAPNENPSDSESNKSQESISSKGTTHSNQSNDSRHDDKENTLNHVKTIEFHHGLTPSTTRSTTPSPISLSGLPPDTTPTVNTPTPVDDPSMTIKESTTSSTSTSFVLPTARSKAVIADLGY